MKKLTYFIIVFYTFLALGFNTSNNLKVYANSKYARVINQTNIYKLTSLSDTIDNVFCVAEKSYFVEILGEYDTTYRVNYNGISGYVKKEDVKEIEGTPKYPFPKDITLTLLSDCNFRSSPFTHTLVTNVISPISKNESDFTFVGRIFSEEATDFGGNTWYFVNYKGNYGYIYNQYVKSISPIYENTETVTFKTSSTNALVNPITHTPSIIIIIILFLPCLLILFILYYPRKKSFKPKVKKEKKEIEKY